MIKKTNGKYLKSGIVLFSLALLANVGFMTENQRVFAEETENTGDNRISETSSSSHAEQSAQTTSESETNNSTSETIMEVPENKITEENNKELGNASKQEEGEYLFNPNDRSDLAITARAAGETRSLISATENNRPAKDFVDISSHNGALSVDNFNEMKKYGVKGVVVKLTEYTTYLNPLAKGQIENAQRAGLIVSVYHYSWFTTKAGAEQEAIYFAQKANELGLPKNTLLINDAEQTEMTAGNVTENSLAFQKKLNSLGYSRVAHYSMFDWFNRKILDEDKLGSGNSWVASYPYNPLATNLLHTGNAAWQWSSELTFPGVPGRFDINVSYNNLFLQATGDNGINLANYHTSAPLQVYTTDNLWYYNDINEFSVATQAEKLPKDTILNINSIEYSNSGYPRLVTDKGYVSANKMYTSPTISNLSSYITDLGKVVALGNIWYYNDKDNFTQQTQAGQITKNTVFDVIGIVFSKTGYPRLVTDKGYVSANKAYVNQLVANYSDYLMTTGKVATTTSTWHYNNKDSFTQQSQVEPIAKNTVLTVKDIAYSASGYPRLVTDKGYVSANKGFVTPIVNNHADYYLKAGKFLTSQNIWYYNDKDLFSVETQAEPLPKETMIEVKDIAYSATGYPRLVTDKGYVSANKGYLSEAISNLDSYITKPMKVVTKESIWYYNSKDEFSSKTQAEKLAKDTLLDVKAIVYSATGYPRLVTNKGYVSANKAYVTPAIGNIDSYITKPGKVRAKANIWHYNNKDNFAVETQVQQITKGTTFTVKGIVYSATGYPRLVTDKGYVSANKTYVEEIK